MHRSISFALLGTALWLLAVLAAQIGVKASLLTGGALVALGGSWTDHYATEAIYLRLNGILPPTAQPEKK